MALREIQLQILGTPPSYAFVILQTVGDWKIEHPRSTRSVKTITAG